MDLPPPGLSMEGRSKAQVSALLRKAVGTQILFLGPLSPSIVLAEFSADALSCTPSVPLKGASLNCQITSAPGAGLQGGAASRDKIPSHFSHEDQRTLCFPNDCLPSWCP